MWRLLILTMLSRFTLLDDLVTQMTFITGLRKTTPYHFTSLPKNDVFKFPSKNSAIGSMYLFNTFFTYLIPSKAHSIYKCHKCNETNRKVNAFHHSLFMKLYCTSYV